MVMFTPLVFNKCNDCSHLCGINCAECCHKTATSYFLDTFFDHSLHIYNYLSACLQFFARFMPTLPNPQHAFVRTIILKIFTQAKIQ